MADQKMKINRLADKVRGIPLRDVLEHYGSTLRVVLPEIGPSLSR
jgi:hypothetical protein